MAQNSARNLLTSVDNLFTTQAERDEAQCERVITIPTEQISSFPGHPFHVHIDDKMWEMVDSVKQHGILVPTLVRPKPDGGYQMVAGHRRKLASELAGVPLPCIIRDLTDDEATIIMVDSNLQRENILPSEKAFAYKMKLDAMKRQGVRTDLTSCPVGAKFRSDEELASNSPDSARQIQRYIRLTYLLPELLTMVDLTGWGILAPPLHTSPPQLLPELPEKKILSYPQIQIIHPCRRIQNGASIFYAQRRIKK